MVMKKLFYVLIVFSLFISDCTNNNNDLVKTTFTRSFDKDIIYSYFTSNSPSKIKAALLSVSHSEDTSFIPSITALPFKEYSQLICFAVGQIGPCYNSTEFLWGKTISEHMTKNSRFIFEALGKTGSEKDLAKITNMYSNYDAPTFPYSGISLAVRQFAFRGITSERAAQILVEEVTNPLNATERKNDALFTLARTGSSDKINIELGRNLMLPPTNNPDTIKLKQYSLMNFRTQKYFPTDENILKSVLPETNVLLKIETARSLSYRQISTQQDIDLYLKYLSDENPNVCRAAANSIVNLNPGSEGLKDHLKMKIEELFFENLTGHTLGELLLSYSELFKLTPASIAQDILYNKTIPSNYRYNFLGKFNDDPDILSKFISEYNTSNNLNDRISILNNLVNFQKNFNSRKDLFGLLIENISSEHTPLVAITAESIDSVFVLQGKNQIKQKIRNSIINKKDNPDFAEGTISLLNLSEKIDSNFYSEMTELALESTVYSVRKFISEKKGFKVTGEKPSDHLDEMLENSFAYKTAEVKTSKGIFIIEFLPQYAPVSVGNFCTLAEKNFFNNVQFHRVVPGFVIQCGDKSGTGWGGPGYEIISETSPFSYDVGMVGMASSGKDTEGSQWFVMQGSYPHLNGRYSLFARVLQGMEVVYNIDQDDKILSVNLFH
jgi:cyclophilin family peptidyl-prolyl cis-trans isomerase